jgi:hypothetical protein
MPDSAQIRSLLDEHYPGWVAEDLAANEVARRGFSSGHAWLAGAGAQKFPGSSLRYRTSVSGKPRLSSCSTASSSAQPLLA